MIEYKKGNIFNSKCQVLVNPVNTVGVMGAGLALQFRLVFPKMFERYKELCEKSLFHPGQLWLWTCSSRWAVLNFPTKKHWKDWSESYLIEAGLEKFLKTYRDRGIQSVAFPILGTGKGGLKRNIVIPLMEKYLGQVNAHVEIWDWDETIPDYLYEEFKSYYSQDGNTFDRIVLDCKNFDQLSQRRGVSKEKISKEIQAKLGIETYEG